MQTHQGQMPEALRAIEIIRKQYGRSMICCGNPNPGHPGDGWMQPPDPPECCQCPEEDVGMLLDTIAAALAGVQPALAAVQPEIPDKVYSDGTTATGPSALPSMSTRQQFAAKLMDSVEAMLGGANGPTIQLRGILATAQPSATPLGDPELEFLTWFYINADFGPADGDVRSYLREQYEDQTGKQVPPGYRGYE